MRFASVSTSASHIRQMNQSEPEEKNEAAVLNTAAFMESNFYFLILSKIVNVVYIVLCILGFKFLFVHTVLYC